MRATAGALALSLAAAASAAPILEPAAAAEAQEALGILDETEHAADGAKTLCDPVKQYRCARRLRFLARGGSASCSRGWPLCLPS